MEWLTPFHGMQDPIGKPFWDNVYGFNMSCVRAKMGGEAIVDEVDSDQPGFRSMTAGGVHGFCGECGTDVSGSARARWSLIPP
eukprot:2715897-Rhodomonas_salina.1